MYEPKIEVRLVKKYKRLYIHGDVKVADRYGEFAAVDLTPWIGENGSVTVRKTVREPMGGFSITFADRELQAADGRSMDTLYAMIEPMDLVEIRFCHDPFAYAKESEGYRPPIVMRGLVTEVSRGEIMSGGRPNRTVSIAGHDFGKILQIIQISYLDNSPLGNDIISEFAFFHRFSSPDDAKIKPAAEFIGNVIDRVINKYLARFTSLANGKSVGAAVINAWTPKVTLDGVIDPYLVNMQANVTLYQMLASLLDVGPFNELYVEDESDAVALVARPAPFRDAAGNLLQGSAPVVASVPADDVVALNLSRSDAGVANYFWVTNQRWAPMHNEDSKLLYAATAPSEFMKFDYENSHAGYFGIRKMEVNSALGPPDYLSQEGAGEGADKAQTDKLMAWLGGRRKLLADINKDNVLFEQGSIRLRGREDIRAGMEVLVERGRAKMSRFYCVGVSHEFSQYNGFLTTLTVERGSTFIDRSQESDARYRREIDAKGVK